MGPRVLTPGSSQRFRLPPRFTNPPGPSLPPAPLPEYRTYTPPPLGSGNGSTEYSLFGSDRLARAGSSTPSFDPSPESHELLAKAPGYRGNNTGTGVVTGIPGFPPAPIGPRIRRYSDSSSSGISSEDSVASNTSSGPALAQPNLDVAPGLAGLLAPSTWGPIDPTPPSFPRNSSLSELLRQVVRSSVYEETMRPYRGHFDGAADPGGLASCGLPWSEFLNADEEQAYCVPDEPMTLPRITSDLNPNAPAYQPAAVRTGDAPAIGYPVLPGVDYLQQYLGELERCPAMSGGHQRPIGAERRQLPPVGTAGPPDLSPGTLDPELEQFLEDVLAGKNLTLALLQAGEVEDEPPSILQPLY